MGDILLFSDEAGTYETSMSTKQLQRHPFYVRSAFMISPQDFQILQLETSALRKKHNVSNDVELKWELLWKIKNGNSPQEFDLDVTTLENFFEELLKLAITKPSIKVFFTITKNTSSRRIKQNSLLKMHMQDITQRLQFEVSDSNHKGLGLVFVDDMGKDKNNSLRDALFQLHTQGDIYTKYANVKKGCSIELSHHCIGIQFADLCAGIFNGFVKSNFYKTNYEFSENLYFKYILPMLRKSEKGLIKGYGVLFIPNSDSGFELKEKEQITRNAK